MPDDRWSHRAAALARAQLGSSTNETGKPAMTEAERIAALVGTLRFLAGGWVAGEDDQRWLAETADSIERSQPDDWVCCPLCAETTCDSGCPLAPIRTKASR